MAVSHLAVTMHQTRLAMPRPVPPGLEALRRYGRAARLHPEQTDVLVAVLQAFARVMGKRLVFFEPGAQEVSFDESWLLNLFDAVRTGDTDRYQFALLSRMGKADAADLHFRVCKAAWTLEV